MSPYFVWVDLDPGSPSLGKMSLDDWLDEVVTSPRGSVFALTYEINFKLEGRATGVGRVVNVLHGRTRREAFEAVVNDWPHPAREMHIPAALASLKLLDNAQFVVYQLTGELP